MLSVSPPCSSKNCLDFCKPEEIFGFLDQKTSPFVNRVNTDCEELDHFLRACSVGEANPQMDTPIRLTVTKERVLLEGTHLKDLIEAEKTTLLNRAHSNPNPDQTMTITTIATAAGLISGPANTTLSERCDYFKTRVTSVVDRFEQLIQETEKALCTKFQKPNIHAVVNHIIVEKELAEWTNSGTGSRSRSPTSNSPNPVQDALTQTDSEETPESVPLTSVTPQTAMQTDSVDAFMQTDSPDYVNTLMQTDTPPKYTDTAIQTDPDLATKNPTGRTPQVSTKKKK